MRHKETLAQEDVGWADLVIAAGGNLPAFSQASTPSHSPSHLHLHTLTSTHSCILTPPSFNTLSPPLKVMATISGLPPWCAPIANLLLASTQTHTGLRNVKLLLYVSRYWFYSDSSQGFLCLRPGKACSIGDLLGTVLTGNVRYCPPPSFVALSHKYPLVSLQAVPSPSCEGCVGWRKEEHLGTQ